MGQLKRKTEMPAERREMIDWVRGQICAACRGPKGPVTAFCKECLSRVDEAERRVLNGSPFGDRYQGAWYFAKGLLGAASPREPA